MVAKKRLSITILTNFKGKSGGIIQKPTVGIFFYGQMHFEDCTPVVREFITSVGDRANIIPVFSRVEYNLEAISKYFFSSSTPVIDLMVNMQYFRLHGGPYGGDTGANLRPTAKVKRSCAYSFFASTLQGSKNGEGRRESTRWR
jgi:cobalamin biosynthesis Mg chelatase CobN